MGMKESGLRGSIRNVSTGIGAAISIDTLEAENVEADSATIRGEITELTNFGEDAEVFFEWGEITEGLPNTTDIQLQDTVGVFTEDLTNLSEDTEHEFQAFGSVRDVSDEGVVLTFETGAAIPDPGTVREWDRVNPNDDLVFEELFDISEADDRDGMRIGNDNADADGDFYFVERTFDLSEVDNLNLFYEMENTTTATEFAVDINDDRIFSDESADRDFSFETLDLSDKGEDSTIKIGWDWTGSDSPETTRQIRFSDVEFTAD